MIAPVEPCPGGLDDLKPGLERLRFDQDRVRTNSGGIQDLDVASIEGLVTQHSRMSGTAVYRGPHVETPRPVFGGQAVFRRASVTP